MTDINPSMFGTSPFNSDEVFFGTRIPEDMIAISAEDNSEKAL